MPEERGAVKLVWDATDDWAPYVRAHMEAIRAKYFAHAAAQVCKGAVAKQLPPAKLISRLANAAATSAPAQ